MAACLVDFGCRWSVGLSVVKQFIGSWAAAAVSSPCLWAHLAAEDCLSVDDVGRLRSVHGQSVVLQYQLPCSIETARHTKPSVLCFISMHVSEALMVDVLATRWHAFTAVTAAAGAVPLPPVLWWVVVGKADGKVALWIL